MSTGPSKARYAEHLATSGRWQSLRAQLMERSGGICECCSQALATQAHHLRYHRWGAESIDDLLHVCRECHTLLHGGERP